MFSFLKPSAPKAQVAQEAIMTVYKKYRLLSLLGVFLGYMAYYLVRNNFALSTPYLSKFLHLSKTDIGLLTGSMLIAYGLSKGIASSLSDKASPKKFMAFGLVCCAVVNIFLGFTDVYFVILGLVILNGIFQGMGVGPSFITIAKWYPKSERGRIGAIWNVSHNIGGGIVAPIVGVAFLLLSTEHWKIASYTVPAAIAILFAVVIMGLVKESPENEGLPSTSKIMNEMNDKHDTAEKSNEAKGMSSWQIFKTYVLTNKNAWYVSLVDTFVYVVRFGMITWLPIYLLQVKGFSKAEMGFAFLVFEWAAIPSTLFAGYISDKLFKGYRMPPAIVAMIVIFFCVFGYWQSSSLLVVTAFAAIVGCLIYVPQFLASVQTMEVVPPFAVGSAVGLRGFMSYIFGASIGTGLFGKLVDIFGWDAGFYLLLAAVVLCIFFCVLTHFGAKDLAEEAREAQRRLEAEEVAKRVSTEGALEM